MAKAIIKSTGEIIEISYRIDSTRYGVRYVIAGTSKSVAESDIMIFDDSGVLAFIEKWHPDYYHSDMIAWIDDLHCALDNECDDEKLARIEEAWGTDPKGWLIELINLESAAYRHALERYYSLMYPKLDIL